MLNYNVLIASPATDEVRALGQMLEDAHARVSYATDGYALQRHLAPSSAINCVLVDLRLEGWRRVIGQRGRAVLPTILLGRDVPSTTMLEAWRAGFVDCIPPTAESDALNAAIRRALPEAYPDLPLETSDRASIRAWAKRFVAAIEAGNVKLPKRAEVILELDAKLKTESWNWDKLTRTIENDGAVVARVIALSNRADRGGQGTTLRACIERVGAARLRRLVIRAEMEVLFQIERGSLGETFTKMWDHQRLTARLASEIDGQSRDDDVYLHAITHRIGELYLLKQYAMQEEKESLSVESITQLLDIISAQQSTIGGTIFRTWAFPPSFEAVARFQERPERISDPDALRFCCICVLAWRLIDSVGFSYAVDAPPGPSITRCFDLLKIKEPAERLAWHARARELCEMETNPL